MSEIVYAPVRDDRELEILGDILCRSFEFPVDGWGTWMDRVGAEAFRVVRRGDSVLGGLAIHDYGHWFGGRCVPAGGIAAVGIAPEERGTGAAARLMAETVRELRGRGLPLSTLYASTQRLYRKVGYEQAGVQMRRSLPGSSLRPIDRDLEMRAVKAGDRELFEDLHQEWAARHDGNLRRTPATWEWMADAKDGRPHAYLVGPEARPEGYLLFRQKRRPEGYDINVRDLVALTPGALARIWTFLADHRSLAGKIEFPSWPCDPTLALLDEQTTKVESSQRFLVRIADVPGALAARGYPEHVDEELHLEVLDEVVRENDGRFLVRVRDGRAEVTEGGVGRLRLSARALAPLYTGLHTPADLLMLGWVTGDEKSLEAAARVFAGPVPWMPDTF